MVNLRSLTEHRLGEDEARELHSRSFSPDDVASVLMDLSTGEKISVPVLDHESYLGRLRSNGVDVRDKGRGDFGYSVQRKKGEQRLVLYRR